MSSLSHKSLPTSCRLDPGVVIRTFGRRPARRLPTAGLFFVIGKTPGRRRIDFNSHLKFFPDVGHLRRIRKKSAEHRPVSSWSSDTSASRQLKFWCRIFRLGAGRTPSGRRSAPGRLPGCLTERGTSDGRRSSGARWCSRRYTCTRVRKESPQFLC